MPTYDYECKKCGHRFHLFQPITSKPKARCPKCKGISQRLISGGGGIIFKGSGFYVTDYRRKEEKSKFKEEETKKANIKKPEKTDKAEKSDKTKKTDTESSTGSAKL